MKLLDGLPEPLTAEQENEAFGAGNVEEIVMGALAESVSYAKQSCRSQLPDDELLSLTYAALMLAIRAFKLGKIRFASYAKPYIRGEITKAWKSRDSVKNSFKAKDRTDDDSNWGAKHRDLVCPDDADEGGNAQHTGHCIALSLHDTEPYTDPDFDGMALRERWSVVEPVLKEVLTEKERTILQLRHVRGLTFKAIAAELKNTSRDMVWQIHYAALRKVRNKLMDDGNFYEKNQT